MNPEQPFNTPNSRYENLVKKYDRNSIIEKMRHLSDDEVVALGHLFNKKGYSFEDVIMWIRDKTVLEPEKEEAFGKQLSSLLGDLRFHVYATKPSPELDEVKKEAIKAIASFIDKEL